MAGEETAALGGGEGGMEVEAVAGELVVGQRVFGAGMDRRIIVDDGDLPAARNGHVGDGSVLEDGDEIVILGHHARLGVVLGRHAGS